MTEKCLATAHGKAAINHYSLQEYAGGTILKAVIGMERVDKNGVVPRNDGINVKATAKIPYEGKKFTVEK